MATELAEFRQEVVKAVRPYKVFGLYVEALTKGSDQIVVRAGKVYPEDVRWLLQDSGLDMNRVVIRE